MTDSTLNKFIAAGTAADRAAFTPSPPTPASGAAQGYFWHETDTGDTYSWKAGTGWIKVNTGSASSFTSWKDEVRAATTANGTLASAFENGDTIDGVVLATGDRILIKNQSTATENGIYVVAASGSPTRATDADTGAEMLGAIIPVMEGTVNADKIFKCTNNATISLGSTNLVFIESLDLAAAGSQGDILYRGANGWARLAAGTSGQFLKTQGASANPVWATASGGAEAALTVPTSSLFTLQNAGSSSMSDVSNGVLLTAPSTGGIRFMKYTAGPASFTSFTMIWRSAFASFNSNNSVPGIAVLRNSSSGKIVYFSNGYLRGSQYLGQRWSSYTAFSANAVSPTTYAGRALFPWQKIDVSGGTITYSMSPDGINWVTVGTEPTATYLTSIDEVGIGSMVDTTDAANCVFQSFTIA